MLGVSIAIFFVTISFFILILIIFLVTYYCNIFLDCVFYRHQRVMTYDSKNAKSFVQINYIILVSCCSFEKVYKKSIFNIDFK